MSSKCRGCGQPIKWVEMASGKKMPLDEPSMAMIQVKEGIGEVIQVYLSHFFTCPKAKDFKNGKSKKVL